MHFNIRDRKGIWIYYGFLAFFNYFNTQFVKMTENFDEFEKKIIKTLEAFLLEATNEKLLGDRVWTKSLTEKIGDLGIELGYKVAARGFQEKYERDWLYDIVWYIEDEEKRLQRVPLIVESEWVKSGIKYDFEKLLVGKAERRLMICQARKKDIDDLFEKLKNAVNAFQGNTGDRFLIAILDSNSCTEFYFKSCTKT